MITLIGSCQTWELVCVCIPVEVAAIHHTTTYLCSMTVHILRGGVRHDVAAPLEGTAVDGCGESVIDDEWNAMLVRHLGKTLHVEHIAARIADGLAEEALGVGTELLLDALIVPVGVNEGALDAEFLHRHAKEVERAAIDGVGGDEVVASLADVKHGVEVSSLTA